MATVNDIGVPGQPATNLTAWQAAVRDAFNTPPAALATGAAVSAPTSGLTELPLTSAPTLSGGFTLTGGKLVIPKAGLYMATMNLSWKWSGDGAMRQCVFTFRAAAGATLAPAAFQLSPARRLQALKVGAAVIYGAEDWATLGATPTQVQPETLGVTFLAV